MADKKLQGFFSYVTISEYDEKWQFVCTDGGSTTIAPYVEYPPHKNMHPNSHKSVATGRILNEYQIVYITQGKGELQANNTRYAINPGTVFIIFPGMYHTYKPAFEIGWTEYWVGFKGPYLEKLQLEGFISPDHPCYYVGLQNSLLSLYDQILEEIRSQKPFFQLKASSYTLSLLAEILSYEKQNLQHCHSEQIVEKAKFIMEEHVYGEIHVDFICRSIGVSSSHLNDVFKSYTGMTPYHYFIGIKIHKAKELLEKGDQSIKEIAFRLGFTDQYYFSRLFKKKTGISPSHWASYLYR